MKIFSSEFVHSYRSYSFGYCNWALREKSDALADIYSAGYLPYSGKPGVKDTFYMARSARVALKKFALSSENRRIAKKFDGKLSQKVISLKDFDIHDKTFLTFCTDYFKERHGSDVMPKERLLTILEMNLVSDIVVYTNGDEKVVAYVLLVNDKKMGHFWFSFYDLSYINQSLGMWLMLDQARRMQEAHKEHLYVGTVYGEKALYKTNFKALEYWNGSQWSTDVKELKKRSRTDHQREWPEND